MASEFISVDSVVAEAASAIKNFTQQERQLARQWAYRALMDIGVGKLNIKVSDPISLTDWSAEKPPDLFKTIDLSLNDTVSGNEIVTKFKGRASDEVTDGELFPRVHKDVRSAPWAAYVTEDDTYFNVQELADRDSSNLAIIVKYYSFPVDSDGLPRIPSTHVMAIMMYIRYMWSMRERKSLSEVQEARNTWLIERAKAYGQMKTPTMLEGKEIARGINSMIQKPVLRHREF
jgi:hypothetical protein